MKKFNENVDIKGVLKVGSIDDVEEAINNIPSTDLSEIENNIDALDTALTVTNTNVSNIQNELNDFIKIDGSSNLTRGDIKIGDSFGFQWGTSGLTKMIGYDNDVIQISTSNPSGNTGTFQITTSNIDINAENISISNGESAVVIENFFNKVSIQSNGYFSTLSNDLLTGDRMYSFPDESGEFMLGTTVKYRTTANLTANYSNGASGVGATLTATTNSPLPTIDGITLANQNVGDRILVANQTTSIQNGIYMITSKGVAGVLPFILTRATDSDTSAKIYRKIIKVVLGSANNSCTVINTNTTAITMGTTAITYIVHGGFVIGSGLNLTNKTISIPNNTISRSQLSNAVATSVIGRSVNSAGAVADIQATADGQFLKRIAGVLAFSSLVTSDLTSIFISDSYSAVGTATTSFPINISTFGISNTTYKVILTPTSALSFNYYVANKTTTSFEIVFSSPVTGNVNFDYVIYK